MNIKERLNKAPKIGEVYDLQHQDGGVVRLLVVDIAGIYAKVKVLDMTNLKDITVHKLRQDDKKGFKMELNKFITPDKEFTCTKVDNEWTRILYGR